MSVALSFIASQAAKQVGKEILMEVAMKMAMNQFNSCKQSLANKVKGIPSEPKPNLTFKQRGARLATQALHEAMNSRALQNGMQAVLGTFGATAATASFMQANQEKEDLFRRDKAKSEQAKQAEEAKAKAQVSQSIRQEQSTGRSGMRR